MQSRSDCEYPDGEERSESRPGSERSELTDRGVSRAQRLRIPRLFVFAGGSLFDFVLHGCVSFFAYPVRTPVYCADAGDRAGAGGVLDDFVECG